MNPSLKQPQKQQSNNRGGQNSGIKSLIITKILPLGILVGIIVIAIVATVKGNSSSKESDESSYFDSSDIEPSYDSGPDVVVDNSGVGFIDAEITNQSTMSVKGSNLVFGIDLALTGATPVAGATSVNMGEYCTVTPVRSCTYRYDTNQIDMCHSSGAILSVCRASLKEDLYSTDIVDNKIQSILESNSATDIKCTDVFVGSSAMGRIGIGNVEVDGNLMLMKILYIQCDGENFTVMGLCDPKYEDYLDLLVGSVTINSKSITYTC